ncbi:hypothetical protein [Terrimonas ferruginea]|uniref:hypothetical protein n=1 Tax=Terrimonas ferruginea TaxID=249 RepID=UPI00042496A5|nr:hypothetical protein [Terrimonas ferruginea]
MSELRQRNRYRPDIAYLALLLLITAIAYWPVSLHIFSLKNDALNYFLPVRRLVSESFHNGQLSLWTPYLNLGYPLHGDMQSGAWNSIVQLFSLFGPYTLYTLQLETLLYVFLSGTGMYYLLKHFNVHPLANIMASVAFMLCGFNSDSCQFLNWISSASFLPYVFLFYYRCLEERSIKQGIYTAVALYFLFNCAYPADFIITAYLMIAMLIRRIILDWRKPIQWKNLLLTHGAMMLLFLVLSLPAIFSFYQSLLLTERGTGASYEDVMSNPLHPALLSSYLTPLAVWKMPGVEITDPLERNSYIGLLAFILMLTAFFYRKLPAPASFCKGAMLVFLLFSLGEMGGLRIVAYYVLPLMDSFRHPANAKLFTLFFGCVLAGLLFHQLITSGVDKRFKRGWAVCLLLLVLLFAVAILSGPTLLSASGWAAAKGSLSDRIKQLLESLSAGDLILLNILLQVPFLILLFRFIRQRQFGYATTVGILNCIVFTMLFQPFTVVKNTRAAVVQQRINEIKKDGYPVPDLRYTLAQNGEGNEQYMHEIGVRNMYSKQIGRSDYRVSPSNLLVQNQFWFNEPLRQRLLQHPLLYSPAFIFPIADTATQARDSTGLIAFIDDIKAPLRIDTSIQGTIQIKDFAPQSIHFETNAIGDNWGVIMINRHPRWELYRYGQRVKLLDANVAFMAFEIPPGPQEYELTYYQTDLQIAWWISTVVLFLFIAFVILTRLRKASAPALENNDPAS